MSERKVWFITRPERDPQYHAAALKALQEATDDFNVVWQGNRDAHKKFEATLAQHKLKRNNISADGSGGRTWCAMLKTFAYCYVDHNGYIKPTKVGLALLNGEKEYVNVKKQILTLQIPNAYFLESGFRPKFSSKFKIRPARFLIKVVHSPELNYYVTKEEITYFVLTAQQDNELQTIVNHIVHFRNSSKDEQNQIKQDIAVNYDHRARNDHAARDYFQAHSDVAHTFMLLCEFTGLVEYVRGDSILKIDPTLLSSAKEVLKYYDDRYPFNNRYLISLERMAQNNGLDIDSYKANEFGEIKPATNLSKYQYKIESVRNKLPNFDEMSREERLPHFADVFGPVKAEQILNELEINPIELKSLPPAFVEEYLGGLSPLRFEKITAQILEAIGFDVIFKPKLKDTITEIEIYVHHNGISGIIDTKYYKDGFALSQNLANYMASEYIKNYQDYNEDKLTFYGYITSEKYSGEKKLAHITALAEQLTGQHIEGFIMKRDVLLGFLDYCKESELPKEKRIQLFLNAIKNQGIKYFDID
ncbi:AlwI family type II restriction endonuclease [Heyndrickxia sp. NPDC080065]|uniref:AlwI family type II restriction endonuclease n=1 Tax=Heyndrickxia sp. NPDC080065 TaxID=3390568 RepID=UPI003CFE148F